MIFGSGSYSGTFKNIKESTYLLCNKHPNTLTSTYELLVYHCRLMSNYRELHYQGNYHIGGRGSGWTPVMFAQEINNQINDKYCVLVPGSDETTFNVMFYNWKNWVTCPKIVLIQISV